MLRNYLLVAWRNIRRDRVYTFINVAGLAVGITCFLTLFLFIQDELTFDRLPSKYSKEQIYRLYVKTYISGVESCNSKAPGELGPALQQEFPELVDFARIGYHGQRGYLHDGHIFRSGSAYAVDSTFFKLFGLTFIEGNPANALRDPNTIVLTKSSARKFLVMKVRLANCYLQKTEGLF